MPLPPPPPVSAERERMIRELEGAETADLLALCQRFSRSPERIQLYLSVFRRRASAGAQLAASLLCFDLARQGSSAAKHELAVLAPTLAPLARDQQLVAGLLGADPYLRGLWEECRAALEQAAMPEVTEVDEGEVLELDLLAGDVELEALLDFELDIEVEEELEEAPELVLEAEPEAVPTPPPDPLRREADAKADRLLLDLLGITRRGFEPGRAFELRTGRDTEALERLVVALEPLCARSDAAAGLRFLLRMQLALAQRRTGLFGRTNSRRRELLVEALRGFPERHAALGAAELLVQLGDAGCRRRLEETVAIVANWTSFAARCRKPPAEVVEPFLDEAER